MLHSQLADRTSIFRFKTRRLMCFSYWDIECAKIAHPPLGATSKSGRRWAALVVCSELLSADSETRRPMRFTYTRSEFSVSNMLQINISGSASTQSRPSEIISPGPFRSVDIKNHWVIAWAAAQRNFRLFESAHFPISCNISKSASSQYFRTHFRSVADQGSLLNRMWRRASKFLTIRKRALSYICYISKSTANQYLRIHFRSVAIIQINISGPFPDQSRWRTPDEARGRSRSEILDYSKVRISLYLQYFQIRPE